MAYKDQIEFLIVYVREAHPEMLKQGHPTGVVGRPKDIDERIILATECVSEFKFTIPMVIDGMDGKVNADYKAAPVRVTMTDRDGKTVYYAGRGPRDFRLSAVERVLKRLVANKGYVPAPPEPQWGEPVDGLRCGIGLDPPNPRIGEDVVLRIQFKNIAHKPQGLILTDKNWMQNLTLKGDGGRSLLVKPAGMESSQSKRSAEGKRRRRRQVYEIKPGDSVFCDIYGNVEAASASSGAGTYQYQFSLAIDPNTAAEVEADKKNGYAFPLWTGQVNSAVTSVTVAKRAPARCVDCHGKQDYHHLKSYGCDDCHVGQVGTDDFATRPEVCSQCHPRPGQQGRRQILGRDGEFNQASRHVYGRIEDNACLTCHDTGGHKNGTVSLVDPSGDERKAWQGTGSGFCLTCHGQEQPESVVFPADTPGSGYHKSAFTHSTHARWLGEQACAHCHFSHGSPNPALLRGPFVVDPKQTNGAVDTDFGLCWMCHVQEAILGESNAFGKLHGVHVKDRGIACTTCHDVHGPTDPGEPGLINLHANVQSGFCFNGNRNETSGFEIEVERNRGACYVSCHKDGKPRSYARKHKRHTVTCLNCH